MDTNKLTLLDQWLSGCVDEGKYPGTAISIFRRNKLIHSSYIGYADIKTKQAIDKNTLYRCYSMTKPITAIALMMLFDEGKFKLTDPLSKYIHNFNQANMTIFDYEANKDIKPKDLSYKNIKT